MAFVVSKKVGSGRRRDKVKRIGRHDHDVGGDVLMSIQSSKIPPMMGESFGRKD